MVKTAKYQKQKALKELKTNWRFARAGLWFPKKLWAYHWERSFIF